MGELNSQISRLHEAVNPIIRGSSGGSSGRGGALEQEGRSRTGERWEGVKGMSTINPVRYGDKWGMADDEGSSSG